MESQEKFQPDIYPVMYWGLAYGAIAGVALFVLFLLSSFITLVWFPVFLAGLVYGGYRNYMKQKAAWYTNSGMQPPTMSPMDNFKEAVSDVLDASSQIATNEAQEMQQQEVVVEEVPQEEQIVEQTPPPTTPLPPQPPTLG